jgi:hypothetical protein
MISRNSALIKAIVYRRTRHCPRVPPMDWIRSDPPEVVVTPSTIRRAHMHMTGPFISMPSLRPNDSEWFMWIQRKTTPVPGSPSPCLCRKSCRDMKRPRVQHHATTTHFSHSIFLGPALLLLSSPACASSIIYHQLILGSSWFLPNRTHRSLEILKVTTITKRNSSTYPRKCPEMEYVIYCCYAYVLS